MSNYRYYYQQLDHYSQNVYDLLQKGFQCLSDSIRVPQLSPKALSELFFQLRLDNPMIFYVVSFSYRTYPESETMEVLPEYLFDKAKIKTHQKAIEARITRVVRPMLEKPPLEQERLIHEFICENVTYDKLEKPYSHEIIGPLTNGVGVCEGISKTVKLLCDRLNLPCLVAICDADPEHGQKYRHAWNILQINGKFYHLDATFDNSLKRYGVPRFDYFNLSDKAIFRDHRPLLYPAPPCPDSGSFYYKANHMSWTKLDDVEKRAGQALRKKQAYFLFHWRGGYLTREVLTELADILQHTAETKGKSIRLSVNWPQAVVLVKFLEQIQHADIQTEKPDEGNDSPLSEEHKQKADAETLSTLI